MGVIFADRRCAMQSLVREVLFPRRPTKVFWVDASAVAAAVSNFVSWSRLAAMSRLAQELMRKRRFAINADFSVSMAVADNKWPDQTVVSFVRKGVLSEPELPRLANTRRITIPLPLIIVRRTQTSGVLLSGAVDNNANLDGLHDRWTSRH